MDDPDYDEIDQLLRDIKLNNPPPPPPEKGEAQATQPGEDGNLAREGVVPEIGEIISTPPVPQEEDLNPPIPPPTEAELASPELEPTPEAIPEVEEDTVTAEVEIEELPPPDDETIAEPPPLEAQDAWIPVPEDSEAEEEAVLEAPILEPGIEVEEAIRRYDRKRRRRYAGGAVSLGTGLSLFVMVWFDVVYRTLVYDKQDWYLEFFFLLVLAGVCFAVGLYLILTYPKSSLTDVLASITLGPQQE